MTSMCTGWMQAGRTELAGLKDQVSTAKAALAAEQNLVEKIKKEAAAVSANAQRQVRCLFVGFVIAFFSAGSGQWAPRVGWGRPRRRPTQSGRCAAVGVSRVRAEAATVRTQFQVGCFGGLRGTDRASIGSPVLVTDQ
jgi:hypothetical protein